MMIIMMVNDETTRDLPSLDQVFQLSRSDLTDFHGDDAKVEVQSSSKPEVNAQVVPVCPRQPI
jgi:hypothetical protein